MLILCLVLRLCGGAYPPYILDSANELNDDNETVETVFYPLYFSILSYWFPPDEGYNVCPRWTIPNYSEIEDPTITFVIQRHRQQPLLLIEIKPPSDFQLDSGRGSAIAQVIVRLDDLGPTNQHAPRLYAISAIGKRWRACYTLQGRVSRGGQVVMGVAATDSLRSAGQECWNPDITSDASYAAFQGIVETIKGYVA